MGAAMQPEHVGQPVGELRARKMFRRSGPIPCPLHIGFKYEDAFVPSKEYGYCKLISCGAAEKQR
jgi:hypothetical protein